MALTAFLLAPVLTVAVLVVTIVVGLRAGDRKPAAVGVGASDTGGANALGEWLAGNDPDEVQKRNRALREGHVVSAASAAGPVVLRVLGVGPGVARVGYELIEDGRVLRRVELSRGADGAVWSGEVDFRGVWAGVRGRVVVDDEAGRAEDVPVVDRRAAAGGGAEATVRWVSR